MRTEHHVVYGLKVATTVLLSLAALLVTVGAGTFPSPQAQQGATASISGWFTIIRGDNSKAVSAPQEIYTLTTDGGERALLQLDESVAAAAGGTLQLDRRHISVEGTWVNTASALNSSGTFHVTSIAAPLGAKAASNEVLPAVSGAQPWVSIMCKFSDVPAEPHDLSYFLGMYGTAYPGLDHYWREASYNLINVAGSTARGWYTLPHPRTYYVYNGGLDTNRAANDCTAAADASVNFAAVQGINLMFNAELDGYAWGGAHYMTLDGISKIWYMTWEPPWGYANTAVIAHEMGHGFGLPHSSGAYGATYDNQWDVMSDTWSNCGRSTDATYGCLGQHTISYHKELLGWIPLSQIYTPAWGSSATIALEQLALPQTGNYKMVQIPIGGSSSHFYTVEARRQTGYDYKLPGQAVIIHEVDTTRAIPAHVIDIDGNGNTGDAGAMWTVGEVFQDIANSISVSVTGATATGFLVNVALGPTLSYNISGNTGAGGATLSYTDGVLKTVTAAADGSYSLTVSSGWSGTVTPSHACFTFNPLSKSYGNIAAHQTSQDYTATVNAAAGCANVDVRIAGAGQGSYYLPVAGSTRISYAGMSNGPVKVESTNAAPIIAAERVIYPINGVNTSFGEMMALPNSQLDKSYWLPWYNDVDLDTQLRFANVGGGTATVHVFINGVEMTGSPFGLGIGASTRVSFAGVNNGPVRITSDQNIVAAERVLYKVNNINTSYSEMMALPNSSLDKSYWLPWYNDVDLDTQLRFGNVSGFAASVHVSIGGVEMPGSPFALGVGASTRVSFAGVNSGPVQITSNQNIVASERVLYKVNNINTSFSEMMALPNAKLDMSYWLPWYNDVDLDTQLRFANVSGSPALVHVSIGNQEMPGSPFTLGIGASTRVTFGGISNGPVQITSDQNIVASERVLYKVNNVNTSYSEMMALPNSGLDTSYWLPWYNNVDLDTQLRFGVP